MLCSLLLTGLGVLALPTQETPESIRVGHWIQIRGRIDDQGRLVASRARLKEPKRYEAIIGVVGKDQVERDRFVVLGQPVTVGNGVDFEEIRPGKWGGKRIKLEGRWRSETRFSARKIELRSGSGRDRIEGRVDFLEETQGGYAARIMSFDVFLPADLEVEVDHEGGLARLALAEDRGLIEGTGQSRRLNDDLDDDFGGGTRLGKNIGMFGQAVAGYFYEDNYNLDEEDHEDELDLATRLRLRFHYFMTNDIVLVAEGNWVTGVQFDEGTSPSQDEDMALRLGENFLYWSDAFGVPDLDLQFGRQDFDDQREWIYDENLDAFRAFWSVPGFAIEGSVGTQIGGNTDPRNQGNLHSSLYVSNNSRKKHLAGWMFYRDIDAFTKGSQSFQAQKTLHVGARVLGEWIPDTKSWVEGALLFGDREGRDLGAWAYDVGTTWEPDFANPFYFTVGYALGSGEESTTGTDTRFSQTGFEDNSARFGGVSSFRYYGELLRPELTNMGIFTTGIGAKITNDLSVDLVYHNYRLDVVTDDLDFFDPDDFTNIKPDSIAADPDLGWETDLVFGMRGFKGWDFKLIFAYFEPGDALPDQEGAFFSRFQMRFRF